jgi:hypothetical protein
MKLVDMSFLDFFCRELVRRALDKKTDKGRTGCFFAECQYSRHSTKREPLPSVTVALGKVSVAVTWHRDGDFSLLSTKWHSTKSLPSARQKVIGIEAAIADV